MDILQITLHLNQYLGTLIAQKNPQTLAKRERENALREKRERKQAKKAEAAAARRATANEEGSPGGEQSGE